MKMLILLALLSVLLLSAVQANAAWKQDRFMITVWCAPPAEDGPLAAYKAEGYTLTWATSDKLDLVQKHGLKALINDGLLVPDTLDNPEQLAKLDKMIETVKNHPAMEGYYLTDEPGTSAFAGWGKLVAYLKKKDPKHLAYINLYPTYASHEQLNLSAEVIRQNTNAGDDIFVALARDAGTKDVAMAYREYLRQFVEVVKPELISYDHYHFYKNVDGSQYFLNLELIRESALENNLPFLNIIQADTIVSDWRLPNKDELRFLVYTTIAYGGKGISYFTYWGPKEYNGLYQDGVRMPIALDAAALNKEINSLGSTLMGLKSAGVYHTQNLPFGASPIPATSPVQIVGKADCVLGLFKANSAVDTFMLVNRDYKQQQSVKIKLDPKANQLQEFNRTRGKWETYANLDNDEAVVVALEPGDGRLFRLRYYMFR